MAEERTEREGANQEDSDQDESPSASQEITAAAEKDARKLMAGRKLPFFGGPLPIRTLTAIAVFIAVFVVVWLLVWAVLGTLGLIFGWLISALAGIVAVKLFADRLATGAQPE